MGVWLGQTPNSFLPKSNSALCREVGKFNADIGVWTLDFGLVKMSVHFHAKFPKRDAND